MVHSLDMIFTSKDTTKKWCQNPMPTLRDAQKHPKNRHFFPSKNSVLRRTKHEEICYPIYFQGALKLCVFIYKRPIMHFPEKKIVTSQIYIETLFKNRSGDEHFGFVLLIKRMSREV